MSFTIVINKNITVGEQLTAIINSKTPKVITQENLKFNIRINITKKSIRYKYH